MSSRGVANRPTQEVVTLMGSFTSDLNGATQNIGEGDTLGKCWPEVGGGVKCGHCVAEVGVELNVNIVPQRWGWG